MDAPNIAENVKALTNTFKNVRTHREKRSKTPDLLECAGGARLDRRCERHRKLCEQVERLRLDAPYALWNVLVEDLGSTSQNLEESRSQEHRRPRERRQE